MLRKVMAAMVLLFTVVTVAGCTSSPDDRGDVTRTQEYKRTN